MSDLIWSLNPSSLSCGGSIKSSFSFRCLPLLLTTMLHTYRWHIYSWNTPKCTTRPLPCPEARTISKSRYQYLSYCTRDTSKLKGVLMFTYAFRNLLYRAFSPALSGPYHAACPNKMKIAAHSPSRNTCRQGLLVGLGWLISIGRHFVSACRPSTLVLGIGRMAMRVVEY